ncbi:MAG TPA: beta-ketoacyl-ACP synthase III [bacterium]
MTESAGAGMSLRGSTITGIGRYLPRRVMTNHEIEKMVDTSDEWIVTRTGIKERRIAAPEEASSDLAYAASQEALADAGVTPEQLDLIIVGTATPDMLFPATGCILQDRLGAKQAGAFDLSAACSSWVYAVAVAHGYIASGLAKTVLVAGAETLSKFTNWKDRNTCVLFGDSAGAVVMQACEPRSGFLSFYLGADGAGGPLIALPAGGSRIPASFESIERNQHFLQMNGREVYKFAVRCIPKAIEEAVQRAHMSIDDVDLFIPHQANIRIIDAAAGRLGQPREKFFINVERYGNTSAASVPVALYEAVHSGRVKVGDTVVLVAFGGGLTWGSCALRWTKPS